MRPNPLEAYLAPARTLPGVWRPVLGLLITLGVYVLGMILVVFGWLAVQWVLQGNLNAAVETLGTLAKAGGKEGVVVTLLSFGGIWVGLAVVLRLFHRQSFWTLFDPEKRVRMGDFARGLGLALAFSGLSLLLASILVEPPARAQVFATWAVLLLPLMLVVFIQATAEELLFRGYLLQQMGTRFRSAIAWAVIPSLLFGLMHAWNTTGTAAYYYVAITGITGLSLAVLVWRTGNLWAAVGMHWGVNVMSLTGVGVEGVLSGTQLWLFSKDHLLTLLQLNLASSVVLLIVVASPAGRFLSAGRADGMDSREATW